MGLSAPSDRFESTFEGEGKAPKTGEVLYPLERGEGFRAGEALLVAYPLLFSLGPVGIKDWMPSEDKLAAVVSAGTRRLGFRSRREETPKMLNFLRGGAETVGLVEKTEPVCGAEEEEGTSERTETPLPPLLPLFPPPPPPLRC